MSDEFDDVIETGALRHGAASHAIDNPRPARLVSRLYASAGAHMRASMLACLLKPLGTLALAAVASGVFADFMRRSAENRSWVGLDDTSRYSKQQIFELARFVEQVSPEALRQLAALVADNPIGMAAFSAAAAILLARLLRVAPASIGEKRLAQRGRHIGADEASVA